MATLEYNFDFLQQYFPGHSWQIRSGQSGRNNTTRFITVNGNEYVLRIYESHQDLSKVQYEHQVLLALKDIAQKFSTPEPIQTENGETIIRLPDGKIASVFKLIPGHSPAVMSEDTHESFGRVTGYLLQDLHKVKLDSAPVYPPYYELEKIHPSCPPQAIASFLLEPPTEIANYTLQLQTIHDQLEMVQGQVENLKKLPHQLIHGDLNASNILVDDINEVTAVLDFEFVTYDLRVIEVAVCLSGLIKLDYLADDETRRAQEEVIWGNIAAFLRGFNNIMTLTDEEVQAIPLLMQLRNLDVFIHFLGRYWDGVNSIDLVKERLEITYTRNQWIAENRDKLLLLVKKNKWNLNLGFSFKK